MRTLVLSSVMCFALTLFSSFSAGDQVSAPEQTQVTRARMIPFGFLVNFADKAATIEIKQDNSVVYRGSVTISTKYIQVDAEKPIAISFVGSVPSGFLNWGISAGLYLVSGSLSSSSPITVQYYGGENTGGINIYFNR